MFADNIVGPRSDNELYDYALRFAPTAGIGVIHDWCAAANHPSMVFSTFPITLLS